MSLLYGEADDYKYNNALSGYLLNKEKQRVSNEWLQVYPAKWSQRLADILGENLEINLPPGYSINTIKNFIYDNMQGIVTPRNFWNNAEDFTERAIAYGLIHQGNLVSTSFSSFLVERYLEIGIESLERYRSKGLASYACSLLIDYCIEHELEPVWACRSDNHGSYGLALRLGFEPFLSIPYYKLVV